MTGHKPEMPKTSKAAALMRCFLTFDNILPVGSLLSPERLSLGLQACVEQHVFIYQERLAYLKLPLLLPELGSEAEQHAVFPSQRSDLQRTLST